MISLKYLSTFVPSLLAITLGTNVAYKEVVTTPQVEQRVKLLEREIDNARLDLAKAELHVDTLQKANAGLITKKLFKPLIVHDTIVEKKTVVVKVPISIDSDGVFYQRYSKMVLSKKIPSPKIIAIPTTPDKIHE